MNCKYLFILVIFLLGCNSRMSVVEETYNKELYGKTVIFNDTLQMINKDRAKFIDSCEYNLYVIFNGNCSTCIEDIINWNIMYDNIHKLNPKVNIIVVVYTNSTEKTIELFGLLEFKHSYYIDTQIKFLKDNNFSSALNCSNIISDSKNKIVLAGNILTSKAIRTEFLKLISK